MSALIDISGVVYDRLTALSCSGRDSKGRAVWLCLCSCGKSVEVPAHKLRGLRVKSCGCLKADRARALGKKHSKHGMHLTPEYRVWHSMKQRCLNPTDANYPNYGGRGISICVRWLSFENFYEDMGKAPPGLSLDRFPDNDGNYEPGNCRWATVQEQANNRRTNVFLTFDGLTLSKTQWSRRIGITFESLTKRINRWGVHRALSTPKKCN